MDTLILLYRFVITTKLCIAITLYFSTVIIIEAAAGKTKELKLKLTFSDLLKNCNATVSVLY